MATGHTEAIGACGFSRKVGKFEVGGKAASNGGGAFAVTASKDRTLKRWNLPGPNELADTTEPLELTAMISARVHEKDINIVTVAPNDSIIASGSQDKTVKLWRSTDLSLQGTLKGHKRGVWDCQFSPHDRVIATASGDRTVKLWSLADCSCVRTFQGHVASALRVRFLSGGLQVRILPLSCCFIVVVLCNARKKMFSLDSTHTHTHSLACIIGSGWTPQAVDDSYQRMRNNHGRAL